MHLNAGKEMRMLVFSDYVDIIRENKEKLRQTIENEMKTITDDNTELLILYHPDKDSKEWYEKTAKYIIKSITDLGFKAKKLDLDELNKDDGVYHSKKLDELKDIKKRFNGVFLTEYISGFTEKDDIFHGEVIYISK